MISTVWQMKVKDRFERTGFKVLILLVALVAGISNAVARVFVFGYDLQVPPNEHFVMQTPFRLNSSTFEYGFVPAADGLSRWVIALSDGSDDLSVTVESMMTLSSLPPAIENKRAVKVVVKLDGKTVVDAKVVGDVRSAVSPIFIRLSFEDREMRIEGGTTVLRLMARLPIPNIAQSSSVSSDLPFTLYRYSLEGQSAEAVQLADPLELEVLSMRLLECDSDGKEGVWQFIDDEFDTDYSLRGGKYRLAALNDENGRLVFYLLNGAEINSSLWLPGMVKAVLTPSPLPGNYDVKWLDAFFERVDDNANAYFKDGILVINFPTQRAVMRFVKDNTSTTH